MQYSFILRKLKINNAGCMVNQRELTEEGLEKNFATNALGKEKVCSSTVVLSTVCMCIQFGFVLVFFDRYIHPDYGIASCSKEG